MGFFYRNLVRPCFFGMEAEAAHDEALRWLTRLSGVSPLVKWAVQHNAPAMRR